MHVTQMPKTWTGEMLSLLRIGVPMALAQFIQFFIFFIDTVMIGRIGPEDLAAAGLGLVIYFGFWMLFSGPVMAVTPLISQTLGKNKDDLQKTRHYVRMAIWVIFLIAPIFIFITLFTENILTFLGQDPVISAKAGKYVFVLAFGLPFALAVMVLRNFLAALEKTFIPLLLVGLCTALNVILNYIFIFGNFGVPRLELMGAGIASSLSYCIGFFIFLYYISKDKRTHKFQIFQNFFSIKFTQLNEILRLGGPISITTLFEGMLFNVAIIIMGLIGVMEAAAYQVTLNIASLAFMLPYGMSMAGAVRIGLAAGARDNEAAKRAASTTVIACICAIMIIAIPVSLYPEITASLFLDLKKEVNSNVINLVIGFLPIATGFMLFDSIQVAANQLLRGLKDVNWPMLLTGISYWLFGFPIAYILALKTDVGPKGVWYGLMAGLALASILLSGRLLSKLNKGNYFSIGSVK
jgi:MATE family multidrug resistance protein